MANTTPETTAPKEGADAAPVAFVVVASGAYARALTALLNAVKCPKALATVHPDGRIVFSGGHRRPYNDMRWWCSVRAHHEGSQIRAPLSFVVKVEQLGNWFDSCTSLFDTHDDLVVRYPASPGRADVGFESRRRGVHDAATLVGISRVAVDDDRARFFADTAPPSGDHIIAAPSSMRAQMLYASSRVGFIYPEAVVAAGGSDSTNDAKNVYDVGALWPSRWVLAGQGENDAFMLFRDYGARTVGTSADDDNVAQPCEQTNVPKSRKRRRRRLADMAETHVRALLGLPAELRYAIIELAVRAWMPTVATAACLADLTSWMSLHAPTARRWDEFRRACRKVYVERASAYTMRRRIGPFLRLHGGDLSTLYNCSQVFRRNADQGSPPDLWAPPRLGLWRPGTCPTITVAGESHAKAGNASPFAFYVVYTLKSS